MEQCSKLLLLPLHSLNLSVVLLLFSLEQLAQHDLEISWNAWHFLPHKLIIIIFVKYLVEYFPLPFFFFLTYLLNIASLWSSSWYRVIIIYKESRQWRVWPVVLILYSYITLKPLSLPCHYNSKAANLFVK